ncbi:MAG: IS1634 family transposase [Bacteroidales bacterium]|nr:IS1634 family transposase [Bacteroidales bacterium]MBN2820340.1 IS1634 family transposase [Bacteroidales bacterium]
MYSIRKVKTKSGSTAIQVVRYIGHKSMVLKHIGSAKDDIELSVLQRKALDWIEDNTPQLSLFPVQKQKLMVVDRGECIGVTHHFAYQFFMKCIEECSLNYLPRLLIDLAIMRLVEPASKYRSIELLQHYFGIKYSQRIYRKIPELTIYKADIEQCAYNVAQQKFNEPFYFVLYDVTTLYFESFKADEFKIQGFSKDNKSQQPQIVIGLLVTQSGFPLSYQIFAGNTFEGKTMLPVLETFISAHPQTKPVIVADAAMLDEERLAELRKKELSYIVGARLPNATLGLVKQIHSTLNGKNGGMARFPSKHGDLVCDFSLKRYKKELNELNKLILKAEELVAKQELKVKTRFIRKVTKEKIELNTVLIEKRRLLLGIKGYCTDLNEQQLSNEKVIDRYHQLWRVEQSFRMSKFDLQTRPIYHQKHEAIKAHVLICFVALIAEKYLELTTKLSLREIRFLVWNITETHIQDNLTKETFVFRSPTKEIQNSKLAPLISKWNLLPH